MIKIFETLEKYNTYTNNGQNLESGDLYYVKEDNSTHYLTNNIDGVTTIYDTVENPSGNIEITENGEDIDIAQYATATVDVPIPEGYIIPTGNKSITANGDNIDVNDYATATVNVPVPPEYIIPTGNVSLTENGENINIAQYATATVNVPSLDPSDMINLIERDITSINIPSGTTKIGYSAFNGCSSLTNITIPNSVTSIGNNSFQSCSGLTSVTIPSSVTSIGQQAFSGCINLPIENNVYYSSDYTCAVSTKAYQSTYSIKDGVRLIADYLFSGCSFASITIPSGTTIIGIGAFQNCRNLTSVTIPNSVTTIGNGAFTGCSGLTSVTIGSGVTTLGDNIFQNCFGLTSITIPNSVTSIGQQAFTGCSGLTSVTIGSGVTTIGQNAFNACTGLTSITVEATTPPTLANANALQNTNNCPIYVPSASVDTYKAASNWSTYASRIQAIPTT